MVEERKNVSLIKALYIHIPFCEKKCPYCDFTAYQGAMHEQDRYVDALVQELSLYPDLIYETIYIGGGTPTLLSDENLKKIFSHLRWKSGAEISMESNPEVSLEKLLFLKSLGVNRLSFGVQSFNVMLLKKLGRTHTSKEIYDTIALARKAGFDNINIDLIYAIPDQNESMIREDIQQALALEVEHISCYSLIWEEGTPFKRELEKKRLLPMDQDEESSAYFVIDELLTQQGYEHYETSNFSRFGFACRHNLVYWRNQEYVAIGLGASGYFNGKRYRNERGFYPYYKALESQHFPYAMEENIDRETEIIEKLMLGLRLLQEGVVVKDIFEKGVSCALEKGYIEKKGDRIWLKRAYWYLANQVVSHILLESER